MGKSLKTDKTKSCGCLQREIISKNASTHKMSNTRFHQIWKGMKERCSNSKCPAYLKYGGRGISVCERWLKFENFRDDMYQPYIEHCEKYGEKQTSIDRFPDNNGNYKLSNCRWATCKEQANNTRCNRLITFKGQTLNILQWTLKLKISRTILNHRIHRGWSVKKTLTTLPRKRAKFHN